MMSRLEQLEMQMELSCANDEIAALNAKLSSSEREREALQKAHDLLNAGFESTCEQMHELKQAVRSLDTKFADSEAARLKAEAACAEKHDVLETCKAHVLAMQEIGLVTTSNWQVLDHALSTDAGLGWHSPQDWEAVQGQLAAMRQHLEPWANQWESGVAAYLGPVSMARKVQAMARAALATDAGQPIIDYIAAARRLREAARNLSEAVTAYTRVYGNDSCLVDVENGNVKMKDCIADVDAAEAKLTQP